MKKCKLVVIITFVWLLALLVGCNGNNDFSISFEVDGEIVHTITTVGNETITMPTNPIKDGYIFQGWYWDKDTWQREFTANSLSDTSLNDNMTVYAKWEVGYTITYNLNGGTNHENNPDKYTIESAQITFGDATKTGHTFEGWYSDAEFNTKVIKIDAGSTGNVKLYAKWTINQYTITFDSNGGSAVSEVTQDFGTNVAPPDEPTREGYTFGGWYTDNETFNNSYTFSTMPSASIMLYAKWVLPLYQRINENNIPSEDGEYILFGEYPQTIKADSVTVGTTPDSRGYYLGSDGCYYAKVTATPFSSGYTFSTGTTVTSGTVYYFKVEPIKWRILSESDGTALILCESIIANKRYNEYYSGTNEDGYYANNYMNSEIRAWLNNEFYNTAFSELQQALIQTTEVDNSVYSTGYSSNPYACANTNDKIFLPSYREIPDTDYGFSNSTSSSVTREKQASDYSRATGARMHTDSSYYGNSWWWSRSPYYNDGYNVRNVNYDGYINDYSVNYPIRGVVPALTIKL